MAALEIGICPHQFPLRADTGPSSNTHTRLRYTVPAHRRVPNPVTQLPAPALAEALLPIGFKTFSHECIALHAFAVADGDQFTSLDLGDRSPIQGNMSQSNVRQPLTGTWSNLRPSGQPPIVLSRLAKVLTTAAVCRLDRR
jgi:hypothetical protein